MQVREMLISVERLMGGATVNTSICAERKMATKHFLAHGLELCRRGVVAPQENHVASAWPATFASPTPGEQAHVQRQHGAGEKGAEKTASKAPE